MTRIAFAQTLQLLTDPRDITSSEYRAIHEMLADAFASAEEDKEAVDDPRAFARAILGEFLASASAMLATLSEIDRGEGNFVTLPVTVPESMWLPIGPEGEDERAQLGVVLAINGARHYLEAYAVHDGGCGVEHHVAGGVPLTTTHGGLSDETAASRQINSKFELLAYAHSLPGNLDTVTIGGRLYALFAEPAGA